MASETSSAVRAFPDRLIYWVARDAAVCVCKTISLSCLPKSHHFSLKCVYTQRIGLLPFCCVFLLRGRAAFFLQSFLSLGFMYFLGKAQIELFPNVLVYVLAKVRRALSIERERVNK